MAAAPQPSWITRGAALGIGAWFAWHAMDALEAVAMHLIDEAKMEPKERTAAVVILFGVIAVVGLWMGLRSNGEPADRAP